MFSETLATPAAAARHAAPPRRHLGRRAAVLLVPPGFAPTSVVRDAAFPWHVVGAYLTSTAVLRGARGAERTR